MQRHAESSAFSKKLTAYFRSHAHFGEEAVGIASAAVWNGDKTPNPLALIECRDDHEVQLAIRIACDYGVPLSVLAGGHDPSLRCVRTGAQSSTSAASRHRPLTGAVKSSRLAAALSREMC